MSYEYKKNKNKHKIKKSIQFCEETVSKPIKALTINYNFVYNQLHNISYQQCDIQHIINKNAKKPSKTGSCKKKI